MIKRIAALSILLAYFIVSAGFAMIMHFCGDRLSDVSFGSGEKSCNCKMAAPGKCCKDKQIDFKITDIPQAAFPTVMHQAISFELLFDPTSPFLISTAAEAINDHIAYRGPPWHSGVPLTIVNSVFRI